MPLIEGVSLSPQSYSAPPEMQVDVARTYRAHLDTNFGPIDLELFVQEAPRTVNNFVFLAREGYYDGLTFHRIVPGFVIQGGCPVGNGTGGPGYRFDDELPRERRYVKGTLAMANAGPNTNGSQFFICTANTSLPPNYSIFGEVTAGMETVEAIESVSTGANDRPLEPVIINSISIFEE